MAEKKKPAVEAAAQKDAPAENVAEAPVAATKPRFGRGILIGAAAAALVVGLGVGGTGGFALAHALHPAPSLAGPGGQFPGGGPGGQMPGGQPLQGAPGNGPNGNGQNGGAQNGPQGPGQNQQDQNPQDQTQDDTDSQED